MQSDEKNVTTHSVYAYITNFYNLTTFHNNIRPKFQDLKYEQ